MKRYVHARLTADERAVLDRLKKATGASESEILRRGLQLVARERADRPSALDLAGPAVGRFQRGPRDLSSNPRHLEEFGKCAQAGEPPSGSGGAAQEVRGSGSVAGRRRAPPVC